MRSRHSGARPSTDGYHKGVCREEDAEKEFDTDESNICEDILETGEHVVIAESVRAGCVTRCDTVDGIVYVVVSARPGVPIASLIDEGMCIFEAILFKHSSCRKKS